MAVRKEKSVRNERQGGRKKRKNKTVLLSGVGRELEVKVWK